jgi:PIN domain nuclease of toxin-antitoxin system
MSVAVTDTHALMWWTLGPSKKLGRRARALFSHVEQRRASIYVPVLALVEVGEAFRRGGLRTDLTCARWTERLLRSGQFLTADLTPDIVLEAESLYTIPERTDRLIAATAVHLECPLITRDPAMSRIAGLTTVW